MSTAVLGHVRNGKGARPCRRTFPHPTMAPDLTRSGLGVPHDRRSIRLPGYDRAQAGAYFLTVCTRNRRHLFGEITAGTSYLNPVGWLVKRCWLEIPQQFPFVELDAFVIMPDHVHGIVRIVERATGGVEVSDDLGARLELLLRAAPRSASGPTMAAFGHPPPHALSAIVGSFKAAAARAINAGSSRSGMSIWQRNYHEHIIRNEDALRRIRRYIQTNPERWGKS